MTALTKSVPRALSTAVALAALTPSALYVGTAPAWAHIHVDADDAVRAGTSIVTFRVPGESDTGSLTIEFSISLPDVASARSELMPGWSAQVGKDSGAGAVTSVTWRAAPGVGISPSQFALFRIAVSLPDTETVSFPATQTYADGTVVRWDQPPLPDGSEPEYPAPMLTLAPNGAEPRERSATPQATPSATAVPEPTQAPTAVASSGADNTARWLAGGALVVAAVGVVLAVASRRRS